MPIFISLRLFCWTSTLAISFLICCVLELGCGSAEADSPDTNLAEPHPNSNTQQIKNEMANVLVQQHSRKLM